MLGSCNLVSCVPRLKPSSVLELPWSCPGVGLGVQRVWAFVHFGHTSRVFFNWYSQNWAFANSLDEDQMPEKITSDLAAHWLP